MRNLNSEEKEKFGIAIATPQECVGNGHSYGLTPKKNVKISDCLVEQSQTRVSRSEVELNTDGREQRRLAHFYRNV